jgi:thioesterase domain-containing protein
MSMPGIAKCDADTTAELVDEQIAALLADAQLLRAGGNAKTAERMEKDAARLRKRLERHMTTREARAGKWEAQSMDGLVAALELMTGEVPEAFGFKLPTSDALADDSCARAASDVGEAPGSRPSDALSPLSARRGSDSKGDVPHV